MHRTAALARPFGRASRRGPSGAAFRRTRFAFPAPQPAEPRFLRGGWRQAGRQAGKRALLFPLLLLIRPPRRCFLLLLRAWPGAASADWEQRRRSALMAAPVLLPCLLGHLGGLLASAAAAVPGSTAARVEVLLQAPLPSEEPQKLEGGGGGGYTLQGALLGRPGLERDREAQEEEEEEKKPPSQQQQQPPKEEEIRGSLVLVGDTDPKVEDDEGWIAVVPLSEEQAEILRGSKEESFTAAVVSKMKRALVLGASALLILALNQNALRELDVSQVLSKPVIVIQTSENVTRLLGALLRGLRATAKITYQAVLLENVGVTLTLWSTCGLSRGGLYGEWQGVICTGENGSRVQKYLQQLWNAILLIALILCTGVIVQAQRQSRQSQPDRDSELDLKQHIAQRLSALKTRRYHPGKAARAWAHDIDSCAICLDRFHKNQCLRVLPCLHEFHRDCVDPWLLLQQTCPLCKDNVLGNCCQDS